MMACDQIKELLPLSRSVKDSGAINTAIHQSRSTKAFFVYVCRELLKLECHKIGLELL